MGKVASTLIKRPLQNVAVEHRAHKLVEKSNKPKTAPLHPSSVDQIQSYISENKDELKKEIMDKNESLHNRLKGMVVNTPQIAEIKTKEKVKKNLPENRSKVEDPEFGYLEPETVREGHVTIKQAMEFLSKHFTDPIKYPVEDIAKDYKLNIEDVRKIVKYFNVFILQIPSKPTDSKEPLTSFLKPSALKKLLTDKSEKDNK
ncbi:hypothetical protein HELRODRAFT_185592 [Helobdella robusta]|uniref:NADH dehydrogenase [ubiquinone] 1 alpha subcomplex assembly factor 4 n=1 Tax=Helobdella robusta TaxID=6412 RepID=T1FN05_HELRO|nr:hypothetical protein HELRODRAFT_185592 [Helobdella robusta]ESO03917.1 hypothetical protein HELRODRAFT_185592 [Helobdella robusta]